jgi:hypothetical protein
MRSRIEPMKEIARSLRNHRELILNYFRAQKMLSSGVVEGLNNWEGPQIPLPHGHGSVSSAFGHARNPTVRSGTVPKPFPIYNHHAVFE